MDLDSALTGKSAEPAGATRILRDDHAEMRRLIGEYRSAEGQSAHARHVIMEAILMQAELHTRIEDDVFYGRAHHVCPEFVDRAREEHGAMTGQMDALQALEPSEPRYSEIADELIEVLTLHMDEEERSLFPQVEREMRGELEALGAQLIRRKESLTRSVEDMEGPAT